MAAAIHVTTIVPAPTAAVTDLARACGTAAGIACRLVWDLSHSAHAADFTNVYLAGPVRLALRIAFVVLLAVLLRLAARRLIGRLTLRAAGGHGRGDAEAGEDEPRRGVFGERRSQRATALASVLGNAASVTIFTVAGVIILGDLGLNLAPVLASAGVLGIAIGFGAQNLVKDFLAGIFMLLEDQYGVGDTVDIDTVTGTVEAVSLRLTRLRDVNGVVWHIRNGTIKRAGNQTQGWARAVIDIPVPAQIPITAARGSLERAAVRMWEEPAWHAMMLDRPQVWGVEGILADTVLIRVAARTAPQMRLEVARELRERLKEALDATAGPKPPLTGPAPLTGRAPSLTGPAPSLTGPEPPQLAEPVPPQAEPPPQLAEPPHA
jgi:moderate conductance mechanosensitive channel